MDINFLRQRTRQAIALLENVERVDALMRREKDPVKKSKARHILNNLLCRGWEIFRDDTEQMASGGT